MKASGERPERSNRTRQGTSTPAHLLRGCPNVPPPFWEELPHKQCVTSTGKLCLKNILIHFLRQGRLSIEDSMFIAQKATLLLRGEPNVLCIDDPVVVVGNICGQLYDLAKIITLGGELGKTRYLFLGGYLGGGGFSSECILFLLAAKISFPDSVFLLRGSHESRFMASTFNFEAECSRKYSKALYNAIMGACNCLPLAAMVSQKYFCVHGGLSPDISRVEDIDLIHRVREVPTKGAMCDLLWSDPFWDVDNPSSSAAVQTEFYIPGAGPYKTEPTFEDNEQRGCSYLFNFACVRHFATVNKLVCVIRSHEVQTDGYKLYRPHPNNNFPCMISVFSAPNYCDTFDNRGAILEISQDSFSVKQFFCSPHPLELYGKNAISWSLPFVVDAVESVLSSLAMADGRLKTDMRDISDEGI